MRAARAGARLRQHPRRALSRRAPPRAHRGRHATHAPRFRAKVPLDLTVPSTAARSCVLPAQSIRRSPLARGLRRDAGMPSICYGGCFSARPRRGALLCGHLHHGVSSPGTCEAAPASLVATGISTLSMSPTVASWHLCYILHHRRERKRISAARPSGTRTSKAQSVKRPPPTHHSSALRFSWPSVASRCRQHSGALLRPLIVAAIPSDPWSEATAPVVAATRRAILASYCVGSAGRQPQALSGCWS